MSWRVVHWIKQRDVTDHQAKLLLMIIGTYADDAGRCYPRMNLLAREASMSLRTAQRVLRRISEDYSHVVAIYPQHGSSNVYQFRCPDFRGDEKSSPATMVAGPPATSTARKQKHGPPPSCGGGTPANTVAGQEPSLNRQSFSTESHSPEAARARTSDGGRGQRGRIGGDRGAIEKQIADQIGPNGFEVLMTLDAQLVDALCARARRGRLTDRDIEKLRRGEWR